MLVAPVSTKPLHELCRQGNLNSVQEYLDSLSTTEKKYILQEERDGEIGRSPLHCK